MDNLFQNRSYLEACCIFTLLDFKEFVECLKLPSCILILRVLELDI